MRYRSESLIDRLAAEYVVGTLRGPARKRFARFCGQEPRAAALRCAWEDRLHGLNAQVPVVRPSAHVWPQIALRTGQTRLIDRGERLPAAGASRRSARWWALAASVAVLSLGLFVYRSVEIAPRGEWQSVAQIATADGVPLWTFDYDARHASLRVRAINASGTPADRALELWALSPVEGGAPVSLGLLPRAGATVRALSPRQVSAWGAARQIAVSLEPPGGSPTGLPTGPVLHVAAVNHS